MRPCNLRGDCRGPQRPCCWRGGGRVIVGGLNVRVVGDGLVVGGLIVHVVGGGGGACRGPQRSG